MPRSKKKVKLIRQAGVIPYRMRDGKPEFCLITSARKQRWAFPKGIIDPGETREEAALKEAYEEAGLHGKVKGEPLGSYRYSKWGCDLRVVMLLMKVKRSAKVWEESDVRKRVWVRTNKARKLVYRKELKKMIDIAVNRIL